jgi:N-acetyl-anhydromuramyl-L-alanine amidase AmpD
MNIYDITDKLPKHSKKRYSSRKLCDIKSIAIHHSATSSGTPAAFARYHVSTNKWPGIGYHYVVLKDGTVFKCNPLSLMTYHVGKSNREAIGICLVGNFDAETPPAAQLRTTQELIRTLRAAFPAGLKLKRHHDYPGYAYKSCPGSKFPWGKFKSDCGG